MKVKERTREKCLWGPSHRPGLEKLGERNGRVSLMLSSVTSAEKAMVDGTSGCFCPLGMPQRRTTNWGR